MNPGSKVKLLTGIAGLLILGGVYGAVYQFQTADTQAALDSDMPELEWLRREFSVPDDRFEKIRALHSTFDADCQRMCQELADSQARLQRIVSNSTEWNEEVQAAFDETALLRERCRRETLQHMYEVCAHLTPDQSQRYRKVISRKVIISGHLPHLDDQGELRDHDPGPQREPDGMTSEHD